MVKNAQDAVKNWAMEEGKAIDSKIAGWPARPFEGKDEISD